MRRTFRSSAAPLGREFNIVLEFGVFDAKLNKKNLNKSQFALAEGA
jgi:hypothetical protein